MSITTENNHDAGKHCGFKTGQAVLVSGDYAVLMFHSDGNFQSRGFLLFFSVVPKGKFNPGGELPYKDDGGGRRTF